MKVTRVFAPVRVQTVEAIRDEIISGRMKPGQRLIERELCEQLDVSRNTLREAYRQLEAEGFLTIASHKGPVVATLTEQSAREIFEMREAMECLAVRLFVDRASDEEVDELLRLTGELRSAHDSGEVPLMLSAKNAFYGTLYAGARNKTLFEQAALLNGRLAHLRTVSLSHPGRPMQSISEIESVVTAITKRNASEASDLWQDHIRNAAMSALDVEQTAE